MCVQSRYTTTLNIIDGLEWTSPDGKVHIIHWKECDWCGVFFIPHHNKQVCCSKTCRQLRRASYMSKYKYRRRILEREGVLVNDRGILNVGTGGLSGHRCNNFSEEIRKVRQEMKERGLR